MSRYCYYFYVNLPLCVYRLSNLIQNLLRHHQKDLLIVQLPARRNVVPIVIIAVQYIDTIYHITYDLFFNY